MNEKRCDDYDEYLKTPQWQAKRSERLKMDNYTCQRCGRKKDLECYSWFEVHHLNYANVKHEDVARDLITLCHDCHDEVEAGKSMYTFRSQIAKYETKLRDMLARDFCRKMEKFDLSAGGGIDFCRNELVKPMLADFTKAEGCEEVGINVKQVNDYFRDRRYEVMEKIYAENPTISAWKMSERTGFKYQMVDKWLKRKKVVTKCHYDV